MDPQTKGSTDRPKASTPSNATPAQSLGQRGEHLARRFLIERGYRILESNLKLKCGEIDLVALDGNTLVFVEVKTRSTEAFGSPAEAVNAGKQHRIGRVARAFLASDPPIAYESIRFDVISVVRVGRKARVEHIREAFEFSA